MQETNFDYKLIIGDDCSTDSTAQICFQYAKRYKQKITLITNHENIGLIANYKQILENYPAKYIAILEGDDYWTDTNKLQNQFDLLEKNPNIGLVHTDCNLLFESGKLQEGSHRRQVKEIKNGYVFKQLLRENYIRPATVMFRQCIYDKFVPIDDYIRLGFKTLDYPMWLDISFYTQFYYLCSSTSVYRIHDLSISNSNQYQKTAEFYKSICDIKSYAIAKFNCSPTFSKSLLNKCLSDRITIEMEFHNYKSAKQIAHLMTVVNFKSFVIWLFTTNRFLINLYAHYIKYRGQMQRN